MKPKKCKCIRCGNSWWSRVSSPKKCPSCMSPLWNKPYVRKPVGGFEGKKKVVEVKG